MDKQPAGRENAVCCCNPFGTHEKRQATSNLYPVNAKDKQRKPSLVIGEYMCGNCRNRVRTEYLNASRAVGEEDSSAGPSGSGKEFEDNCCDPFERHPSVTVSSNLIRIEAAHVKRNPMLTLGLSLCKPCIDYNEALNDVTGLDCSSIKVPRTRRRDLASTIESEPLDEPDFCCNPYKIHKKPITASRTINEKDTKKYPKLLTAGLPWCDNCRNKKLDPETQARLEAEKEAENVNEPDDCCNPYKIHKRPIPSTRTISEKDTKKYPKLLTAGLPWCDNCRNKNLDPETQVRLEAEKEAENLNDFELATLVSDIARELVGSEPSSQEFGSNLGSQTSGSSGSPSLSPSVQREAAQKTLASVGLSPLPPTQLRSKASKVLSAKRKIEEAGDLVRKKVCRALGVTPDEVETTETRKAKDHDCLMEEVKEKLQGASKFQKYQLLSLVPLNWPIREAAVFFNVSRTLISATRQIKEEKGILPDLDFTRTSTVLQSTKDLIITFYCREDNCKIMPGARDCVSMGKGVYEQKRLLLCNLAELYQSFKKEFCDIKVGLTLFSSLKPKFCVFAGSAGSHVQCVCQTHQNMKLLLYALNIKTHYKDLIQLCVCSSETEDRSCMLRLCDKCPSSEKIQEVLKKEISSSYQHDGECDFDGDVKFRQWQSSKGKTELVVQVSSISEVIERASTHMGLLIPHNFIARSQSDYVRNLKENLPRHKVVVQMDFSMNYNCLVQDAVQSYHWSPKQATVHPTVIYYKNEENELKFISLIFISDDLDHDVPLVKKIMERSVAYVQKHFKHVTEVEYSSDGASCQYKSKGYFLVLCRHEQDLKLKASHTYYATSHGKTKNDSDGGTIKRTARKASLQRPLDNQIITAVDLFQFCEENLKEKFQFEFIKKSDVDPYRNLYPKLMESLVTVPGTRSFHFVKPVDDSTLACWRISKDQSERPALVHNLFKTAVSPDEIVISNGNYVIVRLAKQRYLAVVTDVYHEEGEVDVSILVPRLPSKIFKWPNETKTATVPQPTIICTVQLQEENDTFSFSQEDLEKLYSLKVLKK